MDIISQNHGICKEPNTYMRGRQRIAFFCSEYIYTFLDKYGITPFNEVTSSDHRGLFLDLKLKAFLKTPTFPFLAIPSVPLNLQTPKVSSVTKKKSQLCHQTPHHQTSRCSSEGTS